MNDVDSTDLWFGTPPDVFGWPNGAHHSDVWPPPGYDPTRYVVWVPPGRPSDELAPRTALHVQVLP